MNDRTCPVVEHGRRCGKPHLARGWCAKHYKRWSLYGDPLFVKTSQSRARPVEELFWRHVDKHGPDDCWPWKAFTRGGYGRFTVGGENLQAHRVAYTLAVGPIPDGLQIDHMCHRPEDCAGGNDCPHRRCCNPAHLEPATSRDNSLRGGNACAVNSRRTRCKNGHKFTPENTYITKKGHRVCRECRRKCNRNLIERRWEQGLRADGKERQTPVIRSMVREALDRAAVPLEEEDEESEVANGLHPA
jgi:HNH endonuclease